MKLIGDWLHGSGWITLLVQANVTTSEKAESTLSSSHVTRTRYTHQKLSGSLKILFEHAYQQCLENTHEGENTLTFD